MPRPHDPFQAMRGQIILVTFFGTPSSSLGPPRDAFKVQEGCQGWRMAKEQCEVE